MKFKLWIKDFGHSKPMYATSEINNDYSEMGYAFIKVIEIDVDEDEAVEIWDAYTKEQKVLERSKLQAQLEALDKE